MYSALLSLIVRVSRPGLLMPDRDVESLCAIVPCIEPSACPGAAQPPQQVFHRQRLVQRGGQPSLQHTHVVQDPERLAYIYVQTAVLQPGTSTHCQHMACEAVLNAAQAQGQIVLRPALGRPDHVDTAFSG